MIYDTNNPYIWIKQDFNFDLIILIMKTFKPLANWVNGRIEWKIRNDTLQTKVLIWNSMKLFLIKPHIYYAPVKGNNDPRSCMEIDGDFKK